MNTNRNSNKVNEMVKTMPVVAVKTKKIEAFSRPIPQGFFKAVHDMDEWNEYCYNRFGDSMNDVSSEDMMEAYEAGEISNVVDAV